MFHLPKLLKPFESVSVTPLTELYGNDRGPDLILKLGLSVKSSIFSSINVVSFKLSDIWDIPESCDVVSLSLSNFDPATTIIINMIYLNFYN